MDEILISKAITESFFAEFLEAMEAVACFYQGRRQRN